MGSPFPLLPITHRNCPAFSEWQSEYHVNHCFQSIQHSMIIPVRDIHQNKIWRYGNEMEINENQEGGCEKTRKLWKMIEPPQINRL